MRALYASRKLQVERKEYYLMEIFYFNVFDHIS